MKKPIALLLVGITSLAQAHVISEGPPIPINDSESQRTVLVECETKDYVLRDPDCGEGGALMSDALWEAFPQILGCARQVIATNEIIEIESLGIVQKRNVSGSKKRSLHALGRAIDISAVHVGETIHHYEDDLKANRMEAFWNPFYSCIQGSPGFWVIDYRDKKDHYNHIHVSVPFAQRIPGVASGD